MPNFPSKEKSIKNNVDSDTNGQTYVLGTSLNIGLHL